MNNPVLYPALQQLDIGWRGGCAVLRVQPRRGDEGDVDAAAQGELRLPTLHRPDAHRHQARLQYSGRRLERHPRETLGI